MPASFRWIAVWDERSPGMRTSAPDAFTAAMMDAALRGK